MADLLPLAVLQRLWPHGDQHVPGLLAGIAAAAPDVFARNGITAPLTVAVMMGQFSVECGAGLEMVENLSYSPRRLIEVWPRHFDIRNAASYANNPRALGNFIYEPPQHNDLGNRAGTDDGYDYRGRGLSQVTGRNGYAKLALATGLDLLNSPDLVNDPAHALMCAVVDFVLCGCLLYAGRGDVLRTTERLNGGTIGLADRERWTAQWRAALMAPDASPPAPHPAPAPDLEHVDTPNDPQGGGGE